MRCFAIFDELAMLEDCADENVVKHYVHDPGSDSWRVAAIRKNVANGRVKTADSIQELARRTDISAPALLASVERYNKHADKGEDPEYFKNVKRIYPIRTAPFYAVEIGASAIAPCHAGLEIDNCGRVVSRFGEIIPGLYAGGEVLGCTLGRRYIRGELGSLMHSRLAASPV